MKLGTQTLKHAAVRALRRARSNIERSKAAELIVIAIKPDGELLDLPGLERYAPFLNSGEAKDALFSAIRMTAQATGAAGVVFGTEAWYARQTEAGRSCPVEEFERLSREHRFETLVDLGFVTREESIVATAQDEAEVLILSQSFKRRADGTAYAWGEIDEHAMPQEHFRGRQKMFGDLREEHLR